LLIKKLVEKYPSIKLKIAGFGESQIDLEMLVKSLRIEKNVEFLGFVSESHKVKLMSEAWAFIYPSKMEGWGITAIEANACGTPVIASNVAGLKDAINISKSGLLFQYGNPTDLAEKVDLIISNNSLRDYLSLESVNWAENFTWDECSKSVLNILDSLIPIGEKVVVKEFGGIDDLPDRLEELLEYEN